MGGRVGTNFVLPVLVVFSCLPDRGLCFGANPPNRAKLSSFYLTLSLVAHRRETFS